jgi:hypothetical protein
MHKDSQRESGEGIAVLLQRSPQQEAWHALSLDPAHQRWHPSTRCMFFLSFFLFISHSLALLVDFLFWVLVFCLQMNVLVYWVLLALSFWICLIGSIWCIENNWDFGWKCVEWLCIFNWVAIYGGIVSNHLKLRESFSTPFWPFFHAHQVQPFSATISCAFLPAHLVFI